MNKVEDRLFEAFKMSVKDIIEQLHHKNGVSLNELSKRSGVSRQSIKNCCVRMGFRTRTIAEATKLTKNKGDNHFMWGKTKENCALARKSSKRMKLNNPIRNNNAAEKRARTISQTFLKNLLPQEEMFKEILDNHGVSYLMQLPFKKYNLDFFIPALNLCIEIDSTAHWGAHRKDRAAKRDHDLWNTMGARTLRIDKRKLEDSLYIDQVLKANNVIS